jgi:hypothetical protein
MNRVRLVVAGRQDSAAAALVTRWGPQQAALVTPADLSRPGWAHRVGAPGEATAAVGDRVIPADEVSAVIVRLAGVEESELTHLRPEDRGYAAAEMTAFLLAWLDDRSCPVLNRPTPGCLNGPPWHPEQWALAAARAGLRVIPSHRRVPPNGVAPPAPEVIATLVGERCLGPVHPQVATRIRRLAAATDVVVLAVRLTDSGAGAAFIGASTWPDLADPAVADALDAHLEAAAC